MYQAETEGVVVRVLTSYLPEESDPDASLYVWAYIIEIENTGPIRVQLLSRRWEITDAFGRVEIVEGPGVVGEQPKIDPGGRHKYVSSCRLPTDSGGMVGHYLMIRADGTTFRARVPAFSLDLPMVKRVVN